MNEIYSIKFLFYNLKQIKNLQGIRNNLDELEFHLDFFDEIKGLVNNFDLENKKIEEKINKLEEKI